VVWRRAARKPAARRIAVACRVASEVFRRTAGGAVRRCRRARLLV